MPNSTGRCGARQLVARVIIWRGGGYVGCGCAEGNLAFRIPVSPPTSPTDTLSFEIARSVSPTCSLSHPAALHLHLPGLALMHAGFSVLCWFAKRVRMS